MAGVKNMQGVPAHLETIKSKDRRRNMSRCIFLLKPSKICDCAQNLGYYRQRCGGSSKCDYHEEKDD